MPRNRMTVREIQQAWNALVPQANAAGVRNVRPWAYEAYSYNYGMRRLNWLHGHLGIPLIPTEGIALTSPPQPPLIEMMASTAIPLPDMTYGVEIECFMPPGQTYASVARKLTEAGVTTQNEYYNHSVRQHWKIVSDASLGRDNSQAMELVSPILQGNDGLQQIVKACNVLLALRCKINKKCGLHVHVGARAESLDFFKNLAQNYVRFEPVIDSLLSPSRRGNQNNYCRPLTFPPSARRTRSVNALAQACFPQYGPVEARRHYKLSYASFWRHGTVEFRQHQGTIEAAKISHWVRFCLKMAMTARTKNTQAIIGAVDIHVLADFIGLSAPEKEYFVGRQIAFERTVLPARGFHERLQDRLSVT